MTLPNLVSFVRILLVPVFLWLLFGRDDPASAGYLLGAIGATDWVDGYLARRLGQVSELGKFLDPLADRLAVAVAVVGGWIAGVLPDWFAAALVVREALVAIGALVLAARGGGKLEVRYLGKLATFLLYFSIPAFYVFAGTDLTVFEFIAWGLGVPGLVLYWVVLGYYFGDIAAASRGRGAVSSSGTESGETG